MKTPGPNEVKACPECGTEAVHSCWHYNPGMSGSVTTVVMPRAKAAGLKAEHIAGLEAELEAERGALAALVATETDAEMLERLRAEAKPGPNPAAESGRGIGPSWTFDRVLSDEEVRVFEAWVRGTAHTVHTPPDEAP